MPLPQGRPEPTTKPTKESGCPQSLLSLIGSVTGRYPAHWVIGPISVQTCVGPDKTVSDPLHP